MKDEILKSLGKRLREIRNSKDLSQSMLANDANIPKNQIGRIERGRLMLVLVHYIEFAKLSE